MGLYINSALGSYISFDNYDKASKISDDLDHLVPKDYYLWVYDDHFGAVLMFGKRGKFTIKGLPVGLVMTQEEWKKYICPPDNLFTEKEKKEVNEEFEKFLKSFPPKYEYLKKEWSKIDIYLNTFT